MSRQLVLIHGRSQQHKNAAKLKQDWLDHWQVGLHKCGLEIPIPESDVRFPYYGDTLDQMVEGLPAGEAADVIVRGLEHSSDEERFIKAVLREVAAGCIPPEDRKGAEVLERGILNWEWVQSILEAIDRIPGCSGASIALATRDVYQYLHHPAIAQEIDDGVSKAFSPGVETVVVSHSLGTVVAYNLLSQGLPHGWRVPMFITLGSPLAVTEIKETVKRAHGLRCPGCAGGWFNAMDERDVVALHALTPGHFPVDPAIPAIENKTDVWNHTPNHHSIDGYLEDAEVARKIHAALTA